MEAALAERGRRAFRGPVSVTLSLHGKRTNAPASVKAYLDCMEGIFYADDRAVEHLYVQAFSGVGVEEVEKAYIEIEPLRMYSTNFDHAYSRLGGEFQPEMRVDLHEEFERDQLEDLEREVAFAQRGDRGFLDAIEPELLDEWSGDAATRIGQLRFRRLVSRHLYPHDRPGSHPLIPAGQATSESDWSEKELPGSLWLPLPGVTDWEGQVEAALAGHMSRWDIEKVPIDALLGIGLDIAVQGQRNGGKDLDNLARVVVRGFQCVVGVDEEDPVSSYRVYSRPGARDGVRVRVVDARLLEAVHGEVFDSRYMRLRPRDD